ncbi:MAG: hypothetical protein GYA02_08115 [Clostridiaceae bacterium]|nr:hypothetical protein [Clostridiaceae bacterium]
MIKENINLALLQIIQGEAILKEGELTIKPDGNGFIKLRLESDTALMGDVEWTENKHLVIDILSDMDAMTTIDLIFFKTGDNSGESEKNVLNYHMIPTKRVKMAVKLDELQSRRHFLPTLPGTLKGHVSGRPTNISTVNAIEIYVHPGYSSIFKSFTIYEMYLSDELPDMTVIGEPMVDELGQWIQKDWNTKIPSKPGRGIPFPIPSIGIF